MDNDKNTAKGNVHTAAAGPPGEYQARVFTDAGGATLPYRLLRPARYDPAAAYPLVLFLHGSGERGHDNRAQLRYGAGVLARPDMMARHPCFVVAPQCPDEDKWVDVRGSDAARPMSAQPTEPLRLVLALLAELQGEFNIDPGRRYVTGLSMGGYGAWELIVRHPEMFAAAAPICGGGDQSRAASIARLPIWCFHGDCDQAVPVDRSRAMIAAIRDAGGQPIYTELPGVGHAAWEPAYVMAELWDWLFAQRRSSIIP